MIALLQAADIAYDDTLQRSMVFKAKADPFVLYYHKGGTETWQKNNNPE